MNNTEKVLADVWKKVLSLSEEEYQTLNQNSNFEALLPDWCATYELAMLNNGIRERFGISSEELRNEITDLNTLGKQAAVIERFLAITNE